MNTHSSASHQNRMGMSRSVAPSSAAGSRSVHRTQKRWQSRQQRSYSVDRRQHQTKASPIQSDYLLRQQALNEAQQGNRDSAIALFTLLIERNPLSATDYNNRGLVHFQSGQMAAAIADYDKALQLNPYLDSVYNNRANYYAAQGELLEAILDYDTAIELNPHNIRAWINQGITLRDLEMYDRAIECFDLALAFGRLEGHIYAERGRAYHLLGDWNFAIADYQRAIALLPLDSPSAPSVRLRLQVEVWMDDLISPLGC